MNGANGCGQPYGPVEGACEQPYLMRRFPTGTELMGFVPKRKHPRRAGQVYPTTLPFPAPDSFGAYVFPASAPLVQGNLPGSYAPVYDENEPIAGCIDMPPSTMKGYGPSASVNPEGYGGVGYASYPGMDGYGPPVSVNAPGYSGVGNASYPGMSSTMGLTLIPQRTQGWFSGFAMGAVAAFVAVKLLDL